MSQTHSLTGRLAVSAISPLFVIRFLRSLRVCHLEYVKEAILVGFMAHSRGFRGARFDFRELRLFDPRGPCYWINISVYLC